MTRFVTLGTLVLASIKAERCPFALSQPTLVPGATPGTTGDGCAPPELPFLVCSPEICRRTRKDWAGKPDDSWSLELLIGP